MAPALLTLGQSGENLVESKVPRGVERNAWVYHSKISCLHLVLPYWMSNSAGNNNSGLEHQRVYYFSNFPTLYSTILLSSEWESTAFNRQVDVDGELNPAKTTILLGYMCFWRAPTKPVKHLIFHHTLINLFQMSLNWCVADLSGSLLLSATDSGHFLRKSRRERQRSACEPIHRVLLLHVFSSSEINQLSTS